MFGGDLKEEKINSIFVQWHKETVTSKQASLTEDKELNNLS